MQLLSFVVASLGLHYRIIERFDSTAFSTLQPASAFGPFSSRLIQREDQCVAAFGDDRVSSYCTPGNTLCCVKRNALVPYCAQALEVGWYCTEEDGCFTDLKSACGQPGAVSCKQLGPNTTEACCPVNTECAADYDTSENFVRCNVSTAALSRLSATGTSSILQSPSSTPTAKADTKATNTTSITIATSATSSPVRSPAASPETSPTGVASSSSQDTVNLAPGSIAGVVVGLAAAVSLFIVCGWYLRRHKKKTKAVSLSKEISYPVPVSQKAYSEMAAENASSELPDYKTLKPLKPDHGPYELE